MTNRSSLYSSLAVCLMAAGVAGCSGASTSGSMGATPGGAQDNGLAQTQVNQGSVPKPEAFTVEGLLNQYDLPLESQACPQDQALCIIQMADFGLTTRPAPSGKMAAIESA